MAIKTRLCLPDSPPPSLTWILHHYHNPAHNPSTAHLYNPGSLVWHSRPCKNSFCLLLNILFHCSLLIICILAKWNYFLLPKYTLTLLLFLFLLPRMFLPNSFRAQIKCCLLSEAQHSSSSPDLWCPFAPTSLRDAIISHIILWLRGIMSFISLILLSALYFLRAVSCYI